MEKKNIADDVHHYVCGTVLGKGTLYGPAEFLTKRQQRFRRMNGEEFSDYMKKVEESDGFDVGGCSGCLPGRIVPVGGCNWQAAHEAAEFAAKAQKKEKGGKRIEFRRLVKANAQAVSGILFYLTFIGMDTADKLEKTYRAKVWCKIVGRMLLQFEEVPEDGRTVRRKKFVADLHHGGSKADKRVEGGKKVKGKESRRHRVAARSNRYGTLCSKPGGVSLSAWRILLNEVRSRNPSWTYAEAKKAASAKWRSFIPIEKEPYLKEAKKQYLKK